MSVSMVQGFSHCVSLVVCLETRSLQCVQLGVCVLEGEGGQGVCKKLILFLFTRLHIHG